MRGRHKGLKYDGGRRFVAASVRAQCRRELPEIAYPKVGERFRKVFFATEGRGKILEAVLWKRDDRSARARISAVAEYGKYRPIGHHTTFGFTPIDPENVSDLEFFVGGLNAMPINLNHR